MLAQAGALYDGKLTGSARTESGPMFYLRF